MLLFSYDQITQYSFLINACAIGILGVVFILLGWLISRLIRPSAHLVQQELHDIKKELLEELNTSKKFNAEHQRLLKKETDSCPKNSDMTKS